MHQERAAGGDDGAGAGGAVPRRRHHERGRRHAILGLGQHRDLPPRLEVRLRRPAPTGRGPFPGPLPPPLLVPPGRRRRGLVLPRPPRRRAQRRLRRRVEPAQHDQLRGASGGRHGRAAREAHWGGLRIGV